MDISHNDCTVTEIYRHILLKCEKKHLKVYFRCFLYITLKENTYLQCLNLNVSWIQHHYLKDWHQNELKLIKRVISM